METTQASPEAQGRGESDRRGECEPEGTREEVLPSSLRKGLLFVGPGLGGQVIAQRVPPSQRLGGGLAWGSLSLTEAAGIAKYRSQIGIHAGTRLHSYELERAAHQSFGLRLVSDAYRQSGDDLPVFGLIIGVEAASNPRIG